MRDEVAQSRKRPLDAAVALYAQQPGAAGPLRKLDNMPVNGICPSSTRSRGIEVGSVPAGVGAMAQFLARQEYDSRVEV